MKSRKVKVLMLATGLLAAGGICLGAGVAMGGSPSFYYDREGIHVKERESASVPLNPDYVMEYTGITAVKNLDIELEEAKLEVVSGKEWAVEYVLNGWRYEPEYSLENETLTIRENTGYKSDRDRHTFGFGSYWWNDGQEQAREPYVRITVPAGARMKQVNVVNRYGDISVEQKLQAETVNMEAECGEIRVEGWKGDQFELELQYGTLVTGDLEGKRLTVRNEEGSVKTGRLKLQNAEFNLQYGDLSATVEKVAALEAESENGAVNLYLMENMDQLGVSLHSEWGTIRTPEGTVKPDECDGGSDFIRTNSNGAGVRVFTQYGDIRIREEA